MNTIKTPSALFALMKENAVVITPNARNALAIIDSYNAHNALSKAVWHSPDCLSYSQWLTRSYQQAQSYSQKKLPPLLNQHQKDLLWQQVLEACPHTDGQTHGLQQAISSAFTHCVQWQLTPREHEFNDSLETRRFFEWQQAYLSRLNGALDNDLLAAAMIEWVNELPLQHPIILAQFDELTPLQTALFAALTARGVTLHHYSTCHAEPTARVIACDTMQAEREQLIHWLTAQLATDKQTIACVVPNLTEQLPLLKRLLHSHFDSQLITFSMGEPLSQYAMVKSALAILHLKQTPLVADKLYTLLDSPYISDASAEFALRLELMLSLNHQADDIISLQDLVHFCRNSRLKAALKAIMSLSLPKRLTLPKWLTYFTQLLSLCGFPGERPLSSEEYQLHCRFFLLLDELPCLSRYLDTISYAEALALLTTACQQTLFQPQTPKTVRIHVLGLLEAAGLQFDALWIMGMTDKTLPQPARLSPFIPYAIQRQHAMPHATPEREFQFAARLVDRLASGCASTIFSYYQTDNDSHCQASPLLSDFPLAAPSELIKKAPTQLDQLAPETTLPLAGTDTIRGGSFLIKEQALCPFRAFAQFRLKLKTPIPPSIGINDMDRGNLVHHVLEHFWIACKSQQALLALDEATLCDLLNTSIGSALLRFNEKSTKQLSAQFISLEHRRLFALVYRWLTLEKSRPPFTVEAIEAAVELPLNALTLQLRIDRIDRLDDGSLLVIDYKTGSPACARWFESRIEEPQLPLYALSNEAIRAISFGQLKASDMRLKGVSEADCEISTIKQIKALEDNSWSEQVAIWQQDLNALAEEFVKGDVSCRPKHQSLCLSCDFRPLCRIKDAENTSCAGHAPAPAPIDD